MSDDEILDGFKRLSDEASGRHTALLFAIQGLQAQAGYDHAAFVRHLATLQVVMEPKAPPSQAFANAVQGTIEQLSKAPVRLPPTPGMR